MQNLKTFHFKSFLSLNAFLLHFYPHYQTQIEKHSSVHLFLFLFHTPSHQPIFKVTEEKIIIVDAENVHFHERKNEQKQLLESYKIKNISVFKHRIKK